MVGFLPCSYSYQTVVTLAYELGHMLPHSTICGPPELPVSIGQILKMKLKMLRKPHHFVYF